MVSTLSGNPNLVTTNFETPPNNPLLLFSQWLEEAEKIGIQEPRSLVLSTVNHDQQPSSRVVFLRSWDNAGIIFATSQTSRKGKDLQENPKVAGTLWWQTTLQQINFQGSATRLSEEQSNDIFQTRTREAQIISAISDQSAPLISQEKLFKAFEDRLQQQGTIDRPHDWYAYYVHIETIEFWHGSATRMHKRLRYELIDNSWHNVQLQP
jgi:dihydrophenazinedicarboxylate synthase